MCVCVCDYQLIAWWKWCIFLFPKLSHLPIDGTRQSKSALFDMNWEHTYTHTHTHKGTLKSGESQQRTLPSPLFLQVSSIRSECEFLQSTPIFSCVRRKKNYSTRCISLASDIQGQCARSLSLFLSFSSVSLKEGRSIAGCCCCSLLLVRHHKHITFLLWSSFILHATNKQLKANSTRSTTSLASRSDA